MKFRVLAEINPINHDFHEFLMAFTMTIEYSLIFTIIFVICASNYISMLRYAEIR